MSAHVTQPHNVNHNEGLMDEENVDYHMVCEHIKRFISTCAVSLLVLMVFVGVANRWCVLQIHPAALYVLLLGALVLLAYVEALHYACTLVYI
jgi:hypothetical protein